MKKIWYLVLFVAMIVWACSSDSSDSSDGPTPSDDDGSAVMFDRGAMLEQWADNIILPTYRLFVLEMENVNSAFDAFSQDQNTVTFSNLRSSWFGAYATWQRISMFEIGPAETAGFRLNMNTYPTNTDKIEEFLISNGNYDLSLPSNRDVKGFPAMDYLLYGWGDSDFDRIEVFKNDPRGAQIISYLEDVIDDMTSLTALVVDDWENGYRDTFVNNDGSSSTSSVDRFVNDYIFYFEKFLRVGKMGIPLGVFSGTPLPDRLEAFHRSDASKQLFIQGLNAFQDFFNGQNFGASGRGPSLASYLQELNTLKDGERLDILINNQIDFARDEVNKLLPFRTEIENNAPPTNMLMAYDEVQRIVPLLKVDMVSAMSISIDFVDADGD